LHQIQTLKDLLNLKPTILGMKEDVLFQQTLIVIIVTPSDWMLELL